MAEIIAVEKGEPNRRLRRVNGSDQLRGQAEEPAPVPDSLKHIMNPKQVREYLGLQPKDGIKIQESILEKYLDVVSEMQTETGSPKREHLSDREFGKILTTEVMKATIKEIYVRPENANLTELFEYISEEPGHFEIHIKEYEPRRPREDVDACRGCKSLPSKEPCTTIILANPYGIIQSLLEHRKANSFAPFCLSLE